MLSYWDENHTMTVFSNPVATALQLMGGKWKIAILYNLRNDAVRFGGVEKTTRTHYTANADEAIARAGERSTH